MGGDERRGPRREGGDREGREGGYRRRFDKEGGAPGEFKPEL
jgi:small subunit ribosomal protein S10e